LTVFGKVSFRVRVKIEVKVGGREMISMGVPFHESGQLFLDGGP
jgi:hypothetical protein